MAKKLGGLSKFLLSLLGLSMDKLFEMGAIGAQNLLKQGWAEDPALVEHGLKGIYPIVDKLLEKYVLDTKSKVDDKFVAELKQTIEDFATEHGFELPNVDSD